MTRLPPAGLARFHENGKVPNRILKGLTMLIDFNAKGYLERLVGSDYKLVEDNVHSISW
jgi:hypothetical protein